MSSTVKTTCAACGGLGAAHSECQTCGRIYVGPDSYMLRQGWKPTATCQRLVPVPFGSTHLGGPFKLCGTVAVLLAETPWARCQAHATEFVTDLISDGDLRRRVKKDLEAT